MDDLLTMRQLAAKLQVSTRHITSMRSRAMLPTPLRIGRAIRWRTEEIDAWLAAGAPCVDRWAAMRKGRAG